MATNRGGVNVPVSATWNGRALKQAESQLGGFKKSFGKAFMGIGAAAGAAVGVTALGDALVNMASAAAEDQKSVVALSKALRNVGLGGATAQAEAFIKQMMIATGVADDELRPAYQKLATASGSLESAQQGLTLGLDLQAAGYGDLGTVTKALSAAYAGNTTALSRLKLPLDKSILASKDMTLITEALTDLVGGQAAAAANTYAGQLQRVQTAAGEAGETIGYELLRSLETVGAAFGGTDGVTGSIDAAGESLADFVAGLGVGVKGINDFILAAQGLDQSTAESGVTFGEAAMMFTRSLPGYTAIIGAYEKIAEAGEPARDAAAELTEELNRAATMRDVYAGKTRKSTYGTEQDTEAVKDNRTALERLRDTMDKFNGRNRSIIGQRMDLREGFAQGPQGEMVGKGKNRREVITAADAKRWALEQASTASSLSQEVFSEGGKGSKARARGITDDARARIVAQLRENGVNRPVAFANSILSTPGELQPGSPGTKNGPNGGVTYVYQFGDIKVDSSAALKQAQIEAARLAALSGSRYAGMADTKKGYR